MPVARSFELVAVNGRNLKSYHKYIQMAKKKRKGTGRGGSRKGAGRPKGAMNKRTIAEGIKLSVLAQQYTEQALGALAWVMMRSRSHSARVSAAVALLDRGYGRPPQSLELSGKNGGPIKTVTKNMNVTEAAEAYESSLRDAGTDE